MSVFRVTYKDPHYTGDRFLIYKTLHEAKEFCEVLLAPGKTARSHEVKISQLEVVKEWKVNPLETVELVSVQETEVQQEKEEENE